MATLTPISPSGAGTLVWDSAPATALADANDGTYAYDATNADATDLIQTYSLEDVDGDFDTMDALSWRLRYYRNANNTSKEWANLKVCIRNAAGTVVLAGASSTYANRLQTVASAITATTVQEAGVTAFTYVNTTATDTDWNGAIVEVAISINKIKGGSTDQFRVTEVEFTGTYTAGGTTYTDFGDATVDLSAATTDTHDQDDPGSALVTLTSDSTDTVPGNNPSPANRADEVFDVDATAHTVSLTDIGTISAGDGILMVAATDSQEEPIFPNEGTDWIVVVSEGTSGSWTKVVYRKATGSEGTSISVTLGAAEQMVVRKYRFDSADIADWATTPPEGTIVDFPTATTNPDPPSHTVSWASGEDNWWLAGFGWNSDYVASAFPSDTTDTGSAKGAATGGSTAGWAERYETQLDTWNPTTFTVGSNNGQAFTVAVRPSGAGNQYTDPGSATVTLTSDSTDTYTPGATSAGILALQAALE